MSRKSKHETCHYCEARARIQISTSYWELSNEDLEVDNPERVLIGNLPQNKNLCGHCFLKLAQKRGVERSELRRFQQRLFPVRLSEPDQSPKDKSGSGIGFIGHCKLQPAYQRWLAEKKKEGWSRSKDIDQ